MKYALVAGNTYEHKEKLKELGAKWSQTDRLWKVPAKSLDAVKKAMGKDFRHAVKFGKGFRSHVIKMADTRADSFANEIETKEHGKYLISESLKEELRWGGCLCAYRVDTELGEALITGMELDYAGIDHDDAIACIEMPKNR